MSDTENPWEKLTRYADHGAKWLTIAASTCWIPIVIPVWFFYGDLFYVVFPWCIAASFAWTIFCSIIALAGPGEPIEDTPLASHGKQFDIE